MATRGGEVARREQCAFCGAAAEDAGPLVAMAGERWLCGACIEKARAGLAITVARECSFCGRRTTSSTAASAVVICEGCLAGAERATGARTPRKVLGRVNSRMRCSFCNADQRQARELLGRPDMAICSDCAPAAAEVAATGRPVVGPRSALFQPAERERHACGFCGMAPPQVTSMVKAGRGRICGDCLALAVDAFATA